MAWQAYAGVAGSQRRAAGSVAVRGARCCIAAPQNAKGRLTFINRPFMFLVPTEGLEPPHLAAHGPEPCASTNSATWAITAKERDYSRNLTAVNHLCVAIAYSWKWAKTICYIGRGALGK